jgi:hypothetical protein
MLFSSSSFFFLFLCGQKEKNPKKMEGTGRRNLDDAKVYRRDKVLCFVVGYLDGRLFCNVPPLSVIRIQLCMFA